jgi:LEA14-like dessication related protein
MKRLIINSLPSLLILTILLVSCSTPKELEYREFRNLSVQKVGFSTSSVKMDMIYYNPNGFGLQLKRTELDLFVNGVLLGHSSQEYQITIPKKDQFIIPITMEVDMKNLLRNSLTSLFKKEVTVKATGSIKVGKANVFMSIPVNYEGVQSLDFFD